MWIYLGYNDEITIYNKILLAWNWQGMRIVYMCVCVCMCICVCVYRGIFTIIYSCKNVSIEVCDTKDTSQTPKKDQNWSSTSIY